MCEDVRCRIILKTCGTTTPLNCIERIVWLVQTYTAYDMIEDAYYSRKNFKRPELQYVPHRTFEQEVNILDKYFLDGGAYCMGNMNKVTSGKISSLLILYTCRTAGTCTPLTQ